MHLVWNTNLPNDDYDTQTQPVLATNIGTHKGLLVVGGAKGSLYAYDALSGLPVWSRFLTTATFDCGAGNTSLGVGGTTVYDPVSKIVYATSNAGLGTAASPTANYINSLNIADGSTIARVNMTPEILPSEEDFTHTAITLQNGALYAGTSSLCDISWWRGRVAAVHAATMTLSNSFFTAYDQPQATGTPEPYSGGGVWTWGGVSIDPNGNLWTAVGNLDTHPGSTDSPPDFIQGTNEFAGFAEHILELSPDISTAVQSNYPGFHIGGSSVDLDFSGTPIVGQPVGCDTAVAAQGKSGSLYVYDAADISSGPVGSYQFTKGDYKNPNIGNPAFDPMTGLYYATVASSGSPGDLESAPGMVAIKTCDATSTIGWNAAFGPDSLAAQSPRGAPTVTAGGVVLVGTPCENDATGGCTGTSGSYGGALWALDASTGALLNGGSPILTTGAPIRMGAVVDGDWVWVFDNGGDLYGLTLDQAYPAITSMKLRRQTHHVAWPQ